MNVGGIFTYLNNKDSANDKEINLYRIGAGVDLSKFRVWGTFNIGYGAEFKTNKIKGKLGFEAGIQSNFFGLTEYAIISSQSYDLETAASKVKYSSFSLNLGAAKELENKKIGYKYIYMELPLDMPQVKKPV